MVESVNGRSAGDAARSAAGEFDRLDRAVFAAIAGTPTPTLDDLLRRLSNAANYSRLWIALGAGIATVGGHSGRRVAAQAISAIGISSVTVNVIGKQLLNRARPDPDSAAVIAERRVRMPTSTSFPSGHAASAFAFATAVGEKIPALAPPLYALATAVAYSRVHTGVHYPGDVIIGALVGSAAGTLVHQLAGRANASGME